MRYPACGRAPWKYFSSRRLEPTLDPLNHRLDHLLACWEAIPPDGFDALGVEAWLRFVNRFVFESNVSLLRHQQRFGINLLQRIRVVLYRQHSSAYLLKLELHWPRIDRSDSVGDFVTNSECFVFRTTGQMYE